jgi:hypothetical protein
LRMFARLALSLLACAALVRAQVLVDFQVAAPPNVPKNVKTCQITLVEYVCSRLGTRALPDECLKPYVRRVLLSAGVLQLFPTDRMWKGWLVGSCYPQPDSDEQWHPIRPSRE